MINNNVLAEKSKAFAIRIVNLYKHLCDEKHEYVLSKQILRSGTSIGANAHEAKQAQSRPDFYSKLGIALKEASETEYWLDLLHETGYITDSAFASIHADCVELIKILTATVKTKNRPSTRQ